MEEKGEKKVIRFHNNQENSLILTLIHQIQYYDERFKSFQFTVRVFKELIMESYRDKFLINSNLRDKSNTQSKDLFCIGKEMDIIECTAKLFQSKINIFHDGLYMTSIVPDIEGYKGGEGFEFNIDYAMDGKQLTFSSIVFREKVEILKRNTPVNELKAHQIKENKENKERMSKTYNIDLCDNLRSILVKEIDKDGNCLVGALLDQLYKGKEIKITIG